MSHEILISKERYFDKLAQDIICEVTRASDGIIVFSGGNTPKVLNKSLNLYLQKEEDLKNHFLNNFEIFISDERYVSSSHEASNFKMLSETLIHKRNNLIAYNTHLSIEECIFDYRCKLERSLKYKPIILSLLGVGSDGHTASLFPNQYIKSTEPVIFGGKGPDGHARISLSHNLLLQSEKVFFLVNNVAKAKAYNEARVFQHNKSSYLKFPLGPFIQNPNAYFYLQETED